MVGGVDFDHFVSHHGKTIMKGHETNPQICFSICNARNKCLRPFAFNLTDNYVGKNGCVCGD